MTTRNHDRALADACLAGSRQAWARLVEDNRRHVRIAIVRTAARYGADIDESAVDDLESAVFLRIAVDDFRRLRHYRGDAALSSWFRVLASNATVDALRKRRPVVPVGPGEATDIVQDGPGPNEIIERAQLVHRLRALWESLAPADAEFVELFFVQELSFDEISARTGATHGALYARKNRIRKKLIERAAEDGWFDDDVA